MVSRIYEVTEKNFKDLYTTVLNKQVCKLYPNLILYHKDAFKSKKRVFNSESRKVSFFSGEFSSKTFFSLFIRNLPKKCGKPSWWADYKGIFMEFLLTLEIYGDFFPIDKLKPLSQFSSNIQNISFLISRFINDAWLKNTINLVNPRRVDSRYRWRKLNMKHHFQLPITRS